MPTKKLVILTLIVFSIALLTRLIWSTHEGINPDENLWHARTNSFMNVLQTKSYNKMMVAGHPGATITWQSMLSIKVFKPIFRLFDPKFDFADFPYLNETFERVHFIYQFPIMLISSIAIAFIFFALVVMTNYLFAFIVVVFLLTDIYFLGLSRVVQMDAVQTSYLMIALFSGLLFRKTKKYFFLILCSIMIGFAITTKIYSLSLLPIIWLAVVSHNLGQLINKPSVKPVLNTILLTGIMAIVSVITAIILLPPLLIDFTDTMGLFHKSIFAEGLKGTWEGWEYFFGRRYLQGEPKYFYLISYLLRQGILPFVFLPLALLALVYRKIKEPGIRDVMVFTLLAAIFWTIILTIPLKMEDRYILLTHVSLAITAAGGFYYSYLELRKRYSILTIKRFGIGMVLLSSLLVGGYFYYLKGSLMGYHNPLLGGGKTAVKMIRVGWGEGMRDAANYINQQDGADDLIAVSWYESSLAPLCRCSVLAPFDYREKQIDYDVFYINQIQRIKEPEWIQLHFRKSDVVYTSYLNGMPYAWVVERPK